MKQKKFYSTQLLLLAAIALFFSCGSKKQASHYSVQDEISEKLAEYKTAGWQIQGSSRTLRGVLSSVIDRLNENPDLVEVTGTANNFAVVSIGKEAAAANASNRYAATATRLVKGAIDSDAQLSQALGTERDNLYAAYSSTVERLIRGDLKEAYTLVRNRQDGKVDCEIHYLIDEVKAQASREAAMKKALDNVDLDQKYADKIREHVNKRPDIE